MVVGNAEIVDSLGRVKSNLDSGVPQAIQHAAIEALSGPQDCITEHNVIYEKRRNLIVDLGHFDARRRIFGGFTGI